jgi:hypothetical protein
VVDFGRISCRWAIASPVQVRSLRIEELLMASLYTTEQLGRRCVELLDELEMSPPFDARSLCARLGEVRGRRIRVQAADLGGVTVIGHLLALPGHDRILHDSRAPRAQQEHVVYHEVMHLVLGHLDDEDEPLTCGSLLVDDRTGPLTSSEVLYSDAFEWEAETGATELSRLAALRPRPDEYVAKPQWNAERGVAAAFGLVAPRWRSR